MPVQAPDTATERAAPNPTAHSCAVCEADTEGGATVGGSARAAALALVPDSAYARLQTTDDAVLCRDCHDLYGCGLRCCLCFSAIANPTKSRSRTVLPAKRSIYVVLHRDDLRQRRGHWTPALASRVEHVLTRAVQRVREAYIAHHPDQADRETRAAIIKTWNRPTATLLCSTCNSYIAKHGEVDASWTAPLLRALTVGPPSQQTPGDAAPSASAPAAPVGNTAPSTSATPAQLRSITYSFTQAKIHLDELLSHSSDDIATALLSTGSRGQSTARSLAALTADDKDQRKRILHYARTMVGNVGLAPQVQGHKSDPEWVALWGRVGALPESARQVVSDAFGGPSERTLQRQQPSSFREAGIDESVIDLLTEMCFEAYRRLPHKLKKRRKTPDGTLDTRPVVNLMVDEVSTGVTTTVANDQFDTDAAGLVVPGSMDKESFEKRREKIQKTLKEKYKLSDDVSRSLASRCAVSSEQTLVYLARSVDDPDVWFPISSYPVFSTKGDWAVATASAAINALEAKGLRVRTLYSDSGSGLRALRTGIPAKFPHVRVAADPVHALKLLVRVRMHVCGVDEGYLAPKHVSSFQPGRTSHCRTLFCVCSSYACCRGAHGHVHPRIRSIRLARRNRTRAPMLRVYQTDVRSESMVCPIVVLPCSSRSYCRR